MLPPNSKVFVCEKCEAREIMDSDEYVEKSLGEGFENPRLKELLSTARGEDRLQGRGRVPSIVRAEECERVRGKA